MNLSPLQEQLRSFLNQELAILIDNKLYDQAKEFIKPDKDDLNDILKYTVTRGHYKLVKWLVRNGAQVENAFSYAIIYGYLKIVKFLFKNGINLKDIAYISVYYSIFYNRFTIFKFLNHKGVMRYVDKKEILTLAVMNNRVEIVNYLQEYTFEVFDLITYSCTKGDLEMIKSLTRYHITFNAKIHECLTLAIRCNRLEILEYLVQKYDVDRALISSLVVYAEGYGSLEIIQYLRQSINFPLISPENPTEIIIFDPENYFIVNEMVDNLPLDPIYFTPIPIESQILVNSSGTKSAIYFDIHNLWNWWLLLKYASNPHNRAYFTEEAVQYVKAKLNINN